ncbi:PEP-CTERM domain protein [Pelomonas sp. Root1217]|uniref:PEP-CTERM sorting domain-containing protein n=1 Tax=Pelomonas sp. Root1217 TaxID=1736430 RepID=UPI00070D5548|nr:PEP-CTERM sorting domain-containing protein [Pelomonas sp. Root1217]KQV58104.1 PEP-CTERM domain protein [Pelomonas sp. Root1217]
MKLARLLLPLTLAASLGAHAQQGVSLATGLTDFTTWSLYGSATASNMTPGNGFTYSDLQLTAAGTGGQGGAGFAPNAIALDFNQAFAFDFHFFIPVSQGLRGDGFTFTLSDTAGVGGAGSGLGYDGLSTASVAFAIDTFHFNGEPVSPSLQILSGGSVTPLAATETGLGDAIRDPDFQWYASVQYTPSGLNDNAGMLTGTIEHLNLGTFTVSAQVSFDQLGLVGTPVFYGFTAANGLATDGHFVTSAVPVPEPGSGALILAGLACLGMLARRRRAR